MKHSIIKIIHVFEKFPLFYFTCIKASMNVNTISGIITLFIEIQYTVMNKSSKVIVSVDYISNYLINS